MTIKQPKSSVTYQPGKEAFESLTKQKADRAAPIDRQDRTGIAPIAQAGEGAAPVVNPLAGWAFGPTPTPEEYAEAGGLTTTQVSAGGQASSLIEKAKSYIGVPYVWGGTTPTGFDCSGFTQYVYRQFGINLPRVSYQQGNFGPKITLDKLKPGDMVFWDNSTRNNGADHVEIFIGRDAQGRALILGAPAPGKSVRIRTMGANEGKVWGVAMNIGGASVTSSTPKAVTKAVSTGGVDAYLRALRIVESSNNYKARSKISSASGAYQYIRSTWNNYGGYAEAWMAPPSVQDARARSDALRMFTKYGNWEQVAAYHLYPAWAGNRALWSKAPGKGNPTVAAYVAKVMKNMG